MVCRVDEGAFVTSSFSVIHVLVCLQLWPIYVGHVFGNLKGILSLSHSLIGFHMSTSIFHLSHDTKNNGILFFWFYFPWSHL